MHRKYEYLKKNTNHGFGIHGFITITIGHGVTTHAHDGPHGARVATVVGGNVVVDIPKDK